MKKIDRLHSSDDEEPWLKTDVSPGDKIFTPSPDPLLGSPGPGKGEDTSIWIFLPLDVASPFTSYTIDCYLFQNSRK